MTVPRISRNSLMGEVARLNTPLTDENRALHPITGLFEELKSRYPSVYGWGTYISNNLNIGLGGGEDAPLVEKYAFDNAYIAAYGLMRAGYNETGRGMPSDHRFRPGYMYLTTEHSRQPGSVGALFEELNMRQHLMPHAYPEFLEATQTYAYARMPHHSQAATVGAVAMAASEMYFVFDALEEVHTPDPTRLTAM